MSTYKEKLKWLIGRTLNDYYKNIDIKDKVKKNTFTDEYQNKLIKFLLSDVSNQYIVTPLSTDSNFELLYSKNGLAIVTRIIPQKTKLTDDLKMLPTGNKINISSSNGEETSTLNIILDKPLYSMNHNGSIIYDEIIDTNLIKRTVDFLLNGKEDWEIINETLLDNVKDSNKELVLNGDIDTQGVNVTLENTVDNGKVDVVLEGNTEVNLSKTKDPIMITHKFDDINSNNGKLQTTVNEVTTINDSPGKVDVKEITGDTLVNHVSNGSEELILMPNLDTNGYSNVTLTEGIDGGKVDVALV